MQFEDDSGISVTRQNYSEPQDVLEPDCCDGNQRPGSVVLEFAVGDIPQRITGQDGREFVFAPKHVPRETCYCHSEIWCNRQGNIEEPYDPPPKQVRDLFRAKLVQNIEAMKRRVLEFPPLPVPE
jgi:hypothetical protein